MEGITPAASPLKSGASAQLFAASAAANSPSFSFKISSPNQNQQQNKAEKSTPEGFSFKTSSSFGAAAPAAPGSQTPKTTFGGGNAFTPPSAATQSVFGGSGGGSASGSGSAEKKSFAEAARGFQGKKFHSRGEFDLKKLTKFSGQQQTRPLFGQTPLFGGSPLRPPAPVGFEPIASRPPVSSTLTSTSSSATPKAANDFTNDCVVVWETEVTPEQVAKAEKYQLPKQFYSYEHKDPCPGCVGCEKDGKTWLAIP